MGGKGFSKEKAHPPSKPKQKAKKVKGKLDEYVLIHHGLDGNVRVLRLKATSLAEASRKFDIFINTLNLCLSQASDEELLKFVQANPL
jgi:hypothetical protein